ncbi:MAG: hypothetical protein KGN01_00035 [Patescibacteria group bacterium]|nr:hypothetical protein [Patescibacteria group bacterium]
MYKGETVFFCKGLKTFIIICESARNGFEDAWYSFNKRFTRNVSRTIQRLFSGATYDGFVEKVVFGKRKRVLNWKNSGWYFSTFIDGERHYLISATRCGERKESTKTSPYKKY